MADMAAEGTIVNTGILASPAATQPSGLVQTWLYRAAWFLLAASPVVFALATWPGANPGFQGFLRHFSLPIVAIELLVVFLAGADGFQPSQVLSRAPSWAKAAVMLVLLVALGTAFFVAIDRTSAVLRTATSIVHLLFALSLVHLFAGRWRAVGAIAMPSIALGTLAYVAVLVAFVASIADPDTFDWGFFKLGVTNVRQLGFYSAVGAAAAFGLALVSRRHGAFWMWLAAVTVLLAVSFWSGTRSSLIAIVGGYFVSLLMFPVLRRLRAWLSLAGVLVTSFALGFVYPISNPAFGPLRVLFSFSASDADSGRDDIWLGTLRVYAERPVFGFGESQFRLLVPEAFGANHPHNAVLQALFQWGFVGAAACLALSVGLWLQLQKCTRQIGVTALPAYLIVTSLLVYAFYEGTLYHPYPITMLILAGSWILTNPGASSPVGGPGIGAPDASRGIAGLAAESSHDRRNSDPETAGSAVPI